ncbi:hypothetical protein [Fuchsiella alkaliacetigena]|uniref:hypothetical protein n=1 Tax=Fuchsiella alkaliacetigena TaxID=957042 RepID=UPI00200AE85A|nr:hypothetical protein [Fuchsiella alkaliacetigena]MCK8823550.1 hypothetical protein [Fuchsiella alkaliacetigena]
MKKLLIWALVFIILLLAIGLGLQFSGILDLRAMIAPRARAVPVVGNVIASHEIRQEQEQRLENKRFEINSLGEQNQQLEEQLQEYEQELLAALEEIENLEEAMTEQQLEEEDQTARLERIAEIYMTMNPARVAELLAELEDQLAARILNELEAQMAGAVLTELATEDAALYSQIISGEFDDVLELDIPDAI